MPKQENWESGRPNNDSIGLSIDERSMIFETRGDNEKILAIVQKQEQRIKSLENKIYITSKMWFSLWLSFWYASLLEYIDHNM